MPIKAERDAGRAMERIFLFLVLKATANAAAPCATFAAVAMGIQVFCPLSANIANSIALYIWCTPATTVGAYTPPMINAPIPKGIAINAFAPLRTQVSSCENTGPINVNVRKPVTNTDTNGVTKRSNVSGTILCSFFSIVHMTSTAITTGITCP